MNVSPSQMASALRKLANFTEAGCPASAYYVSSDGVTLLVTPIERERWESHFPQGSILGVPLHLQTVHQVVAS